MSTTLRVIGVFMIVTGVFAGIIIWIWENLGVALLYVASNVASGILFIAIAHVVELMEESHFYLQEMFSRYKFHSYDGTDPAKTRSSIDKLQGFKINGIE